MQGNEMMKAEKKKFSLQSKEYEYILYFLNKTLL